MKRGFTLVEILVSIAILSIVIAGIFAVLNIGDMTWHSDMGLVDLQQGARQAMASTVRELRQSRADYIVIDNAGARIQFKIPIDITNDPDAYTDFIIYYINNDNQLIREYPTGTTKVLANNINSLNFSLSADMLEIQLSAQKTVRGRVLSFPISGVLTEQVRLRNE